MSFGGGGGGGMTAHVHNNVPLQGGPLDFVNDTVSSMNAGSTTYSNGAALQELVIGNAGDSLVVNAGATAPEWVGGGGAVWTADGTDDSGAGGVASLGVSGMTGRDITQILFHVATATGTNARLQLRVNGIATGTYCSRFYTSNSTNLNVNNITQYRLTEQLTSQDFVGEVLVFKGDPNLTWTGNQIRSSISCLNAGAGTPHTHEIIMGSGNQPSTAAITQIDMMCDVGNIFGKIQVNSMDYQ